MTYIPLPQKEDGGQNKVWISDDDSKILLLQILTELKKMNCHLEIITDDTIKDFDVNTND